MTTARTGNIDQVRRTVTALLVALLAASMAVGAEGAFRAVRADETVPVYVYAGQSNMVGYESNSYELATIDHDLLVPSTTSWLWGPTDDAAAAWSPMSPVT